MTSTRTIKVEEESVSETESEVGTFACCLCKGESFEQKSQLTAHLLTHDEGVKKEDEKPFVCQICSKAFTWLAYLKQHLFYRHAKGPDPKPPGRLRRRVPQYVCQFGDRKRLGKIPCEFCDKIFSQRNGLVPHHRRAHPDELTACNECGKKFAPNWLEGHVRYVHQEHTVGPPYVCGSCDKEFMRKKSLFTHRRTHEPEEVCDHCGMEFESEQKLGKHMWCHTDCRPFTCDTCGKGFIREGYLKLHVTNHDVGEGQPADASKKPFTCDKCDRSFVQKSHLLNHIRFSHTN